MNFTEYIGQKTEDVIASLENKGFKVIVRNNSFKSKEGSTGLVIRVKLIEDKVVELINGDFSFLS